MDYPYAHRVRQNFTWPVWCLIGIFSIPTIFLNRRLHGWGVPIGLSEIAVLAAFFGYRHFWKFRWFWPRISAFALLQWPLLLWARPYIDAYQFEFNLPFVLADLFVAIVAINIGRPWSANQ